MNLFEILDNNEDGLFYVYELFNPIKKQPFYIGKGKNDRYKHHFTKKSNNKHKENTIRKIISSGEKVIVKIIFRSNNELDALNKESELILDYGRVDNNTGILTNLTNGGEGKSGYIMSESSKINRSNNSKGDKNSMYNKKHRTESIQKMSEVRKNKYETGEIIPTKHSEEWREHLRNNNPSSKKVDDNSIIELNLKGYSVPEIERETGITKRIIVNILNKYNLSYNSKKVKNVDNETIKNLLLSGYDKNKICEELNISISTLNRRLKNN